MKIEFDPAKSARNAKERGLPFELTADLDWRAARVWLDQRRDYGEERYLALVPMTGRLYAVCYCVRSDARRIISFRKANAREEQLYAKIFD
ncbi:MAG: BrnT family toxin [Roseiarcus sp.]